MQRWERVVIIADKGVAVRVDGDDAFGRLLVTRSSCRPNVR